MISIPIVILQYKKVKEIDRLRNAVLKLQNDLVEMEKRTIKGKVKNTIADEAVDIVKELVVDTILR